MKYTKLFSILFLLLTILLCTTSCDFCFHKYQEEVIAPTCTEGGKTLRVCEKCGKTVEVDPVPANGHDYEKTVYPVGCDFEGYTEYVCFCGHSYRVDIIVPEGHLYDDTVHEPDCDDIGSTEHLCRVCGYRFTDSYVSPNGHTLQKSVIAPTCTETGYTTYACSCGFSYRTEETAPLGHSMQAEKVPATCTEEGYTVFTCNCGFTYRSDATNPKGHIFNETEIEPTCTEGGHTEYVCSCGYSFESDFTKPLGHTLKETVTEPTCTVEGSTLYACDCGYSYVSDKVSPKGHQFAEAVTMPTVSEMGYTEYSCQCGFTYVGNYRFYSEILDNAYAENSEVLANGIDVSKYNHKVNRDGSYQPIDWAALKAAGVDYVILKVGSTVRDNGTSGGMEDTFLMDYEGAKAAGLDVGVYFFTYATTVKQIRADAERLLTWLDGMQFEYPIYLDLEDVPKESYYPSQIASPILTEMCLEFFSILQKEGYYTGLYVNNEFLFNILQTENMIELFEIWYARPTSGEYVWDTNKYGAHLGMWQYSHNGAFDAIPDIPFDLNFAYKDYPTIIRSHGFNGFRKQTAD